jgi:hypothetical protein
VFATPLRAVSATPVGMPRSREVMALL